MVLFILLIVLVVTLFSFQNIDPSLWLMIKTTHPYINLPFLVQKSAFSPAILFTLLFLIWTILQICLLYSLKTINRRAVLFVLLIIFFAIIAYPFLSHDIFTYIFSGRMLWCYQANPYTVLPQSFFQKDLWLSFTHWVDVTYAYGPVMLAKDILPFIILGCQRFISIFYSFKIIQGLLFTATGYLLWLKEKKSALVFVYWFLNPLLILELLINGHNDILMIFLYVLSDYLIEIKNSKITGLLAVTASIFTKKASLIFLPLLFFRGKTKIILGKTSLLCLFFILAFRNVSMPWYYTWIYMVAPSLQLKKRSWALFFIFHLYCLVNNYWSFLSSNQWGNSWLSDFSFLKIVLPVLAILL